MELQRYGKSEQLRYIAQSKEPIYPISYVQCKNPMSQRRKVCAYTAAGRSEIHDDLRINTSLLLQLMRAPTYSRSTEYADNRISLFSAQWGKCAVTGKAFQCISEIHCHHPTQAAARTLAALTFGNISRSIRMWYLWRWNAGLMFPVKTVLPISWSVSRRSLWMNTGTTTGATSSASLTIPFWKSMMISTSEWLFGTPPWSAPPTHCCPAAAWSRENTSSMKIF